MTELEQLRERIIKLSREYASLSHPKKLFKPGDRVPYAARVYDDDEIANLVDSSLEFWLTAGRYAARFEKDLASFLGVRYSFLVNSGSSANLLAFMALTSPMLGKRQILPGDEVITVAAGFPTTITPIIQYGAIPVFVDVTIPQYNIATSALLDALSPKTKALMVAHTLGNPIDIAAVTTFCREHGLWFVEDNCDALGSRYCLKGEWGCTGTFGDIGTSSFYPPHHMTMGEGGAVYTNDALLSKIILSLRDWGRDCVCPPGRDNYCGHRFDKQYGELPTGYDHKYMYSHFGYNLKATDMQAAIGCAQLEKLPGFIVARKKNWHRIKEQLLSLADRLVLPEKAPDSDPSWFGFLITVREDAGFTRDQIVRRLEESNIQTRMLFAGNLIRHPCFDQMRTENRGYRVSGGLENTDRILSSTFWVGVYPGMTGDMVDYIGEIIQKFVRNI